jgi:hypothetical protein
VTLVRGCFFFKALSCFDNSLLYLDLFRFLGFGLGVSAIGEVASDIFPLAERTKSIRASYSSIVIVTVTIVISSLLVMRERFLMLQVVPLIAIVDLLMQSTVL